ncbi:MAG: hypothetical protein M1383_04445 [Patescibacteria group bacterium]|nr:hypothetical protein [Patescibacteria group bacterium]
MDPYYHTCARQAVFHDHVCQADPATGKLIEWEHAFIYGGQQVNEKWAIIPLCWYVHRGPGLDKNINRLLALRRATADDLQKYPRSNWMQQKLYLEKQYA